MEEEWFHMLRRVFKGLHCKEVKQQVQLPRAEHSPCRWDATLPTTSHAQTAAHVDIRASGE